MTKVEVKLGKAIHESFVWSGELTCVDSITVTAHTTDGRVWSSPVGMAVLPAETKHDYLNRLVVTREVRDEVATEDIWYHLGGWGDEGDTYDTQLRDFEDELDHFWAEMVGPHERLRTKVFEAVARIEKDWVEITLRADESMVIKYRDGSQESLAPAKESIHAAAE